MWYKRIFEENELLLKKGKVLLLYGPRRVGKTTLVKSIINKLNLKSYIGEGDDINLRNILSSNDKNLILSAFSGYEIIFIDEAQRIPDIGWGLKILTDNLPDCIIIASGSSSFELAKSTGAPLTGRSNTKMLFPLSVYELNKQYGGMDIIQNLENYLIYGMYPETLKAVNNEEKIIYLKELSNSYLLKDILEFENIRNSSKLYDLLRLLAFQIGSEVSMTELGNQLNIAKQTVARYLDLLEKVFVIKKISGFSRNLRKEVSKSHRYYFYDTGIRNAVINNFNPINLRNDIGMIWENFLIMERIKKQHYTNIFANNYFWRTYTQKEIDFVEERDGNLYGYEIKWNEKKKKIAQEFIDTYENATIEIINKNNFLMFVG